MHSKIYRLGLVAGVIVVGIVGLNGCGQSKVGSEAGLSASLRTSPQEKAVDRALTLTYLPAENPKLVPFQNQLEASAFGDLVEMVSKQLALPETIDVVAGECGRVNAFYNPKRKSITICYELMAYYALSFKADYNTAEDVKQFVNDSTIFTFFHELGHGLVDVLELPVLGREEDVADEFAGLTLLQFGESGKNAVSTASDSFIFKPESETKNEKVDDSTDEFSDEHSLDLQRSYGLSCLAYGNDPVFFADIKKNKTLPDRRLKLCAVEYKKKSKSLARLMAPYLR
jgi:Putative metallopeptidase